MPLLGEVDWHYSQSLTTTKNRIMLILQSLSAGASARDLARFSLSKLKMTIKALKLLYELGDIRYYRDDQGVVIWTADPVSERKYDVAYPAIYKPISFEASINCGVCYAYNNGMPVYFNGIRVCRSCEQPLVAAKRKEDQPQ